ncbi:hypothetical protein C8R45DRAFT_1220374 [Mycena sanguinolenta]|nr:hypothetical protein C8R45DRAFT_1220374 [Mycena sanguinolenta]
MAMMWRRSAQLASSLASAWAHLPLSFPFPSISPGLISFPPLLPPSPSLFPRLRTRWHTDASNSGFISNRQCERHRVHEGDEQLEWQQNEPGYDAEERAVSVGEVRVAGDAGRAVVAALEAGFFVRGYFTPRAFLHACARLIDTGEE